MARSMNTDLFWLHAAYWVAAVADFGIAGLVLIPERMGVEQYVYPMGLMAAVAFAWGVMLVLADQRPLERQWVIVPTMLVVTILGLVAVHAGWTEIIPPQRAIATAIVTVTVLFVLALGYRQPNIKSQ